MGDLRRTVQATGRKAWYFRVAKLAVVCLQVHATLPLAATMVLPVLVVSEWVSQFCKILDSGIGGRAIPWSEIP